MSELKPLLILIAGPNGAGKTRLTETVLEHEWLEGCVYINPDQIALERFGDWNSPTAVAEAAQFATELRYRCIAEAKSVALETVFSSDEKLAFLDTALKSKFFVRLFFVATDSPEINAARIAKRVMQGGHTVPIDKVIDRYQKSITNLATVLPVIHRAYIYDNSVEGSLPKLQFRTVEGVVERTYAENHAWSNQVREQLVAWSRS